MVSPAMRAIRGRLAALGLTQYDLAAALGMGRSKLNAVLNGREPAPEGFERRATAALDRLERIELAAAEARSKAVTEMGGAECNASGDEAVDVEALPEVLFLEDMAALLRCSRSTLERRLRARTFPLAPIQGVDKRLRWSKAAALHWLAMGGGLSGAPTRRGRRRTA